MTEALDITKIHSIAGMLPKEQSLVKERPFRSPHHTISYAGLIGGGTNPRPGEVSLAHYGVLFLDELPEFSKKVIEVLRQPIEDKCVTISRAAGRMTYPTEFICIGAMNPCPCGFLGHPDKVCSDTPQQVAKYQSKISGPFKDRMDIQLEIPAVKPKELFAAEEGESSEMILQRVKKARLIQQHRFGQQRVNSSMSTQEVRKHVPLSADCEALLKNAMESLSFSARTADRLLKVARTIADLDNAPNLDETHLLEALSYRN